MKSPLKIISGGQTGVDRAALEWAIASRVPHGGWCPAGRRAEDGRIPAQFNLIEMPSRSYALRTRKNVHSCDGTVIFSISPKLIGGSRVTAEVASKYRKPLLHLIAAQDVTECAQRLDAFIQQHDITVLNVAGPRASEEPGVGDFVQAVLSLAKSFR
jgi:hypothetical protein